MLAAGGRDVPSLSSPAIPVSQFQSRLTPLIEQIHASPTKLVMYVTGGAIHAPTWLLSVPGASRTVLDVRIPYSHESLQGLVKTNTARHAPEKSVSTEMAVAMAEAAFREATNLSPFGAPVLGVGVTCALATDRNRRGEDQAIVCTKDSSGKVMVVCQRFEKAGKDELDEQRALLRTEQDMMASSLVINAVAAGCGIADSVADDSCTLDVLVPPLQDATDAIRKLLDGSGQTAEFSGGHIFLDAPRGGRFYLPGSFNPLHDGHKEMLRAAIQHGGGKLASCALGSWEGGAFELAVQNADKGLLDEDEVARRVAQFVDADLPVVLTRAPLFTTKSELFPGSVFVVGCDTAVRLVQQKYYDDSASEMVRQFTTLVERGCSFLVAGRLDTETGSYCSLQDVRVPEELTGLDMFDGLDEMSFRNDISSTKLRESGEGR